MNIAEATAVNVLLDFLFAEHADEPVDDLDRVRDAVAELADRANKAVHAGWSGPAARLAFDDLDFPGWLDDEPIDFRPVDDVVSDRLVDPDGPQTPDDYRHLHGHTRGATP